MERSGVDWGGWGQHGVVSAKMYISPRNLLYLIDRSLP